MKRISISCKMFDTTFVIEKTTYDDRLFYQAKEYYKDTFKNEDNCLYNVVLDDFDLDFGIDNEDFYIGLEEMCDNIVKKIREQE